MPTFQEQIHTYQVVVVARYNRIIAPRWEMNEKTMNRRSSPIVKLVNNKLRLNILCPEFKEFQKVWILLAEFVK